MKLQLVDKLAFVTGSTAGIGFAIAKSLATEGAHVIVNGRSAARVQHAIAALKEAQTNNGEDVVNAATAAIQQNTAALNTAAGVTTEQPAS